MKNVSRRVATIILLVLVVIVVAIVGFVIYQIQSNQAPTDSSASGFGDTHTTNLFGDVVSEFKNTTCDYMLSQADVASLPSEFGFTDAVLKTTTQVRNDADPISCVYKLGSSMFITFDLYAYNVNSTIDASADALYKRVNTALQLTQLDTGLTPIITWFYGSGPTDEVPTCITTIFHGQNDFEFARITYTGIGNTDCTKLVALNKKLTTDFFGFKILTSMVGVNAKFATPTTTNTTTTTP